MYLNLSLLKLVVSFIIEEPKSLKRQLLQATLGTYGPSITIRKCTNTFLVATIQYNGRGNSWCVTWYPLDIVLVRRPTASICQIMTWLVSYRANIWKAYSSYTHILEILEFYSWSIHFTARYDSVCMQLQFFLYITIESFVLRIFYQCFL